ncbi:Dynein heavy chain 3, axonemal [Bagarius yarrelli]|uniref:Dynein heavy chain 3, axonemal n=1 Tax=Bagarius yarrelli TaxID=175774 RepID=A0A556UF26_BAGYA|nr:Dynein heavy chain 3, axonemal [Bagarius yarrelli]
MIRAPVPWSHTYRHAHSWCTQHLFMHNPIMHQLQELWINKWLPQCSSLFYTYKNSWLPLVPQRHDVAPVMAQKFFSCVAALMSLQLRSLVIASLQDLLHFLSLHQKIEEVHSVWSEIASLRVTVPLSLFCLEAVKLHQDLCERTENLKHLLITYELEENRQLNQR